MELRNAGDDCILDFSDIVGYAFSSMFRHDSTLGRREKRQIERVISEMIDNYINQNLIWARWRHGNNPEEDCGRFGGLIKNHPRPFEMVIEINDMIADLFATVLEIPTWHIVHLQFSGSSVEVSMSEDYRIKDWMEKFGKKYGVSPVSII